MEDSPQSTWNGNRQLPTPADSPILNRSPLSSFPPRRSPSFSPSSHVVQESVEEMDARSTTRTMSLGSLRDGRLDDRFIPRRRSPSQTAFDLLPSPSSLAVASPSTPSLVETRRVGKRKVMSAREIVSNREFGQALRSELFGADFIPESSTTSTPARPSSSQASKRRPVAPAPSSFYPTPPPSRTPVLSFTREPSTSSLSSSSSLTDSPLGSFYRLSPLNSTTDDILSQSSNLPREIATDPWKVLDAPNLSDDYYDSLIDWSSHNHLLAVGLGTEVYLWRGDGQVKKVTKTSSGASSSTTKVHLTSTKWLEKSDHLAVGDQRGGIAIYDAATQTPLRQISPHSRRVGILATPSPNMLTSGSQDRKIQHRDLRLKNDVVSTIAVHSGEVTALKWNENGELASGGNDNAIYVFKGFDIKPILHLRRAHSAAICLDWSPHQAGLLVSGGGTSDQTLRSWNTHTGTLTREIETGSQVCNVLWSRTTNEIVSTQGYSENNDQGDCVHIWKYSKLTRSQCPDPIATMGRGLGRILHLTLSPDNRYIACGSSQEILRFWDVFPASSSTTSKIGSILDIEGKIR